MNYGKRVLESHGNAGRRRRDGSRFNVKDDRNGFGFEVWAADQLGADYREQVGQEDGGIDFYLPCCGQSVDAYCMGKRKTGNFIKNFPEGRMLDSEYADLMLLGRVTRSGGYRMVGWGTQAQLLASEPEDYGFGPKLHISSGDMASEHRCPAGVDW